MGWAVCVCCVRMGFRIVRLQQMLLLRILITEVEWKFLNHFWIDQRLRIIVVIRTKKNWRQFDSIARDVFDSNDAIVVQSIECTTIDNVRVSVSVGLWLCINLKPEEEQIDVNFEMERSFDAHRQLQARQIISFRFIVFILRFSLFFLLLFLRLSQTLRLYLLMCGWRVNAVAHPTSRQHQTTKQHYQHHSRSLSPFRFRIEFVCVS